MANASDDIFGCRVIVEWYMVYNGLQSFYFHFLSLDFLIFFYLVVPNLCTVDNLI